MFKILIIDHGKFQLLDFDFDEEHHARAWGNRHLSKKCDWAYIEDTDLKGFPLELPDRVYYLDYTTGNALKNTLRKVLIGPIMSEREAKMFHLGNIRERPSILKSKDQFSIKPINGDVYGETASIVECSRTFVTLRSSQPNVHIFIPTLFKRIYWGKRSNQHVNKSPKENANWLFTRLGTNSRKWSAD